MKKEFLIITLPISWLNKQDNVLLSENELTVGRNSYPKILGIHSSKTFDKLEKCMQEHLRTLFAWKILFT